MFAANDLVVSLARFVDEAPYASDYTYERIYYRSLRERDTDYLSAHDYIWRWDTDWFWCSKNVGAQHPLLRRLLGRERLNSVTYQRVMRWNSRWGFSRGWHRLRGLHSESVIQDVDIPLRHCAAFVDVLAREIGIWPVWLCPLRVRDPAVTGVHWQDEVLTVEDGRADRASGLVVASALGTRRQIVLSAPR